MYYSATLFQSIGFNNPTAVGLVVSGTNLLGTLFACVLPASRVLVVWHIADLLLYPA